MRGPARVRDARAAPQRGRLVPVPELADLALDAEPLKLPVRVNDRDPGRVVAAIFQSFQPFEQDRGDIALGHRADYAAHQDRFQAALQAGRALIAAVGSSVGKAWHNDKDATLGICVIRACPGRAGAGMPTKDWSGREDLNLRPPAPHAGALPGCATPRVEWL